MYFTQMEMTKTQISPRAFRLQITDSYAPLHKATPPRSPEHALLKRQRCSSPERLRCTRRLNFGALGFGVSQNQQQQQQQQPVAVARRNERERNRVKQVNMGFQTLRQHVPNGAANKKMSKVETLRSAVEYIRALQRLLDEHDAVSAAFRCGVPSPTVSSSCSAGPESPRSACSSDESGYEHLNTEEQELLDFAAWFDGF